jgi:hypothetical protein
MVQELGTLFDGGIVLTVAAVVPSLHLAAAGCLQS